MHAIAIDSTAAMNIGKDNTHDNNNSFCEKTKNNNSSSSSSINPNNTCVSKPVLYASITFRPDNHKLRPIASIKATHRENIYNDSDSSCNNNNNNNMKIESTSVTKSWISEHNKIYPLSNGVGYLKSEKPLFQKLYATTLSPSSSSSSSSHSELIEQKHQVNYTNCATKYSITKIKIANLMKAALWMLQHCIHDNEIEPAEEWHDCKANRTAGLGSVHNGKHDNYVKGTRHNYSTAINNDNNAEYLALRSFALHSLKRFRYDDDDDGGDDNNNSNNNTITHCCTPNVDSLKNANHCVKCKCNIKKFEDHDNTTTSITSSTTNSIIRGSDNQVEISKRHKMESVCEQQEESNTSYLASPSSSSFLPSLALITCDGYRCYDQLMQSSLINMINELFPSNDAQYRIFFFNAVSTTTIVVEWSVSDSNGSRQQTMQSRLCCRRRPCVRLIRFENLAKSLEQEKTEYETENENEEHKYCKKSFSLHLQQKKPLLHIPANTILTEDGRAPSCWHYGMCFSDESIHFNKFTSNCKEKKQCIDTHTLISSNNATNEDNVYVITSNFIKSFLLDHIHNHLIRVNDTWYIQQERGIVQGSPVSMLLCNMLLTHVDQELLSLLEESALHAHCLFTRRVDDILIASTSELAAKTCLARLHRSWRETVGFECKINKIRLVQSRTMHNNNALSLHEINNHHKVNNDITVVNRNASHISWCGLLLSVHNLHASVEWRRILPMISKIKFNIPHLHGHVKLRTAAKRLNHTECKTTSPVKFRLNGIEQSILSKYNKLLMTLCSRLTVTVLCAQLNSVKRVVQTVLELCLLWSRVMCRMLDEYCRQRMHFNGHYLLTSLLDELISSATRLVWRRVTRQHELLCALGSSCALRSYFSVKFLLLFALHSTLQAQLRHRTARAEWSNRLRKSKLAQTHLTHTQKNKSSKKCRSNHTSCASCNKIQSGRSVEMTNHNYNNNNDDNDDECVKQTYKITWKDKTHSRQIWRRSWWMISQYVKERWQEAWRKLQSKYLLVSDTTFTDDMCEIIELYHLLSTFVCNTGTFIRQSRTNEKSILVEALQALHKTK